MTVLCLESKHKGRCCCRYKGRDEPLLDDLRHLHDLYLLLMHRNVHDLLHRHLAMRFKMIQVSCRITIAPAFA